MPKYLVVRSLVRDAGDLRPMDLKTLSKKSCRVLDKPGPMSPVSETLWSAMRRHRRPDGLHRYDFHHRAREIARRVGRNCGHPCL